MKKYNLLILAGGEKGPLFDDTGFFSKALVPIHGKPMLDWVVGEFHNSKHLDNIVVVGAEELAVCASMRYVRKHIVSTGSLVQNLMMGISYIYSNVYHNTPDHGGYLISFCDAAFATAEMIDRTIKNIEKADADAVLHYVEKQTFAEANITAKRTYIPMGGKNYTGTVLYYLRKFSLIKNVLGTLTQLRKHRKDTAKLFEVLGCTGTAISDVEKALSGQLKGSVRVFVSKDAGMGMDVDKPSDLALAREMLASPWKHDYKKAMIIWNPNAGKRIQTSPVFQKILGIRDRSNELPEPAETDAEAAIAAIKKYLTEYNIKVESVSTQASGHATELAGDCAAKGYDLVIAVGGDGTINEVVNGLANTDVTLGVIPFGTVNVLGIELKLPSNLKAACQVIAEGQSTKIDLGLIGKRYFIAMAGVGFDAYVIRKVKSRLKKIFGAVAYGLVAFTQMFIYRFKPIGIKLDNQPLLRKGYFMIIGNCKYYGGEMIAATKAQMSDGYLDVCIFKYKNIFSLAYYLIAMKLGRLDKVMSVEYYQCKKISILKSGRKHPVHVDAEYLCRTPVDIKVCPKTLKIAY